MGRFFRWFLLAACTLLVVFALVDADAWARLGGGQSFGGGGGGGGGSSGGGDGGGLVEILIFLIIEVPYIGIPLTLAFIGYAIWVNIKKNQVEDVDRTDGAADLAFGGTSRRVAVREGIDRLRERDPAFSRFVFLDLCSLIYTRYQESRGTPADSVIRAWVAPELLQRASADNVRVGWVVIGAVRISEIQPTGSDRVRASVTLESNLDEEVGGKTARYYEHVRLTFERRRNATSPTPDQVRALACPSCGAAAEVDLEGRCGYCTNVVNTGEHGWVLRSITPLRRMRRKSFDVALDAGGEEPGYSRPTIVQPNLGAARRAFMARNPDFRWVKFRLHVEHVFMELQQAWSTLEWERARPYETDQLFQTHRYWIEGYRADGRRNVLEDIRVDNIEPAAVERDPFFETITVRIFAAMKDYTIDTASGEVVGGNRRTERRFSEYWTFIRRSGVEVAAERKSDQCPSCGAALAVSETGVCEYCNAKVTGGDFGWTLALIEQDQAYGR